MTDRKEYSITFTLTQSFIAHLRAVGEVTIPLDVLVNTPRGAMYVSNRSLMECYEKQMSAREAGALLGMNKDTVIRRWQNLGLNTAVHPTQRDPLTQQQRQEIILNAPAYGRKTGYRLRSNKELATIEKRRRFNAKHV